MKPIRRSTESNAEKRVVKEAMAQFDRFCKRYGGVQQLLKEVRTGDKLVKACAALAVRRSRGR